MAYTIYDKTGNVRYDGVNKLEYNGTYLGESTIKISINSPTVIDWAIDDYIVFRNEVFVLANIPSVKRVAGTGTYGGALQYENVVFKSQAVAELQDCMMLDYVLSDNKLHFTSLPNFAFFCAKESAWEGSTEMQYSEGVRQLADRLKANLDRLYDDVDWVVEIENDTYLKESKSISVSSQNVWEVLINACEALEINFTTFVGYEVVGGVRSFVKRITLGAVSGTLGSAFSYGKGHGLTELECSAVDNQAIITKLMAYGNTRNMPYRYYNYLWYTQGGDDFIFRYHRTKPEDDQQTWVDEDGVTWQRVLGNDYDAMYIPNLMLPDFKYNAIEGKYEGYILSDNVSELGINEGVKFFDQQDGEELDIYPSITDVTAKNIYDAMSLTERARQNIIQYIGYESDRIDQLATATDDTQFDTWDGIIPEQTENAKRFTLIVKNLGFNPNDMVIDNETPKIEMTSGACAGRAFNILSVEIDKTLDYPRWVYKFNCETVSDDGINQYFPNKYLKIYGGDMFVITGIRMPDIYVSTAEQRLLVAATAFLAENDHQQMTYKPVIDNIWMQEHDAIALTIKEGVKMNIVDSDMGINEYVLVSSLRIVVGDAVIPKYEVTLSDDIEPSLIQRVTQAVLKNIIAPLTGQYGGGGYSINADLAAKIMEALRDIPNTYLAKNKPDTALGPISFVTDIHSEGYAETEEGKTIGSIWSPSRLRFTGGNASLTFPFQKSGLQNLIVYDTYTETVTKTFTAPATGVMTFKVKAETEYPNVIDLFHIVSGQRRPNFTISIEDEYGEQITPTITASHQEDTSTEYDVEYTFDCHVAVEYTITFKPTLTNRYATSPKPSAPVNLFILGTLDDNNTFFAADGDDMQVDVTPESITLVKTTSSEDEDDDEFKVVIDATGIAVTLNGQGKKLEFNGITDII